MIKNLLIAVGITFLFLGLAIQPSMATPQPEKIDVEPDVESLVAQLRVAVNEILQDYGHIPIVRSLGRVTLNTLSLIGKIIYCVFLYLLLIPIFALTIILMEIGMLPRYLIAWLTVIVVLIDLDCPPAHPLLSLPSLVRPISSLTDTNDITNLVDECPCMQE